MKGSFRWSHCFSYTFFGARSSTGGGSCYVLAPMPLLVLIGVPAINVSLCFLFGGGVIETGPAGSPPSTSMSISGGMPLSSTILSWPSLASSRVLATSAAA